MSRAASLYDEDNPWFGFQRGRPAWSRGTWIQFILAAWKLYQNVAANPLEMILLGDIKIRSDASLLFNFGLAANTNAPQEDKDRVMVSELMAKRRGLAPAGAAFRVGAKGKPIQQVWLEFFHRVPRVFRENGNPRVFVRELMDLKFFGYKPVFTQFELGFVYTGGGRTPTFLNYLQALREVGLERRERSTIMRHLGEFLFNDGHALSRIGA